MVANDSNQVIIPTFGVIYAIAIIIAALEHLYGESFGLLGFISWIVILAGVVGFIIYVISFLINNSWGPHTYFQFQIVINVRKKCQENKL